jgi:hypothetical protein
LLPASLSVHDGGGVGGRFGFSGSCQALFLGRLGSPNCVGVLSDATHGQVPASAKPGQPNSFVDIGWFRDGLGPLSPDDGECGGWFAGTVIQ